MKIYRGTKQKLAPFGLAIFLFITSAISPAFSQCDLDWRPGQGLSGIDGQVAAVTTWDPDGAGPQPELLIAGGWFSTAGGVSANNIASWDGNSWQPLGSGITRNDIWTPSVQALAIYNGQLIAGGSFTVAGDVDANNIARWDGNSWQSFGSGMKDNIYALTVYNGQLIAGGEFTKAGEVDANCITSWNGNSWQPLGSGVTVSDPFFDTPYVHALAVYNGDLIAGGHFTTAGSISANNIARWNGTDWQALGNGLYQCYLPPYIRALTIYDGKLIAGGAFCRSGSATVRSIASWNGSSWQPLGSGISGGIYALTNYNGCLIAGGSFTTAGGVSVDEIAQWDGSSWQPLGSGMNDDVRALTIYNGELIAGGAFTIAGDNVSAYIAKWGVPEPIEGDLNHDCVVDEEDLGWLIERWLDNDCLYSGWCYEADLNYDTQVDFSDYAVLANHWLEEFIAGDFSGNNHEDFTDYAIFASAWQSDPCQPNWNPACDISNPKDDVIDLSDLAVFSEYWLVGTEL